MLLAIMERGMISAMIEGEKRPPKVKGEQTICVGCGSTLRAVMPQFKVAHWRHNSGDCDPWSEPEGEWHLGWKSFFNPRFCEVFMRDPESQEIHRADVLCPQSGGEGVVLELQHSPISEEERIAREVFYTKENRMFWLLNMGRTSALSFNFSSCLNFSEANRIEIGGRDFYRMEWFMRGTMLDKWKQSRVHVFLNHGPFIFYLATMAACRSLVGGQAKGEFALARLTVLEFLRAVAGNDPFALTISSAESEGG